MNHSKDLTIGDERDSMAATQAFCKICQSKVSADTMLTGDDLRRSLDRGEEVRVMHVLVAEDGSCADHIWTLSSQEKESLRKYLGSGQG